MDDQRLGDGIVVLVLGTMAFTSYKQVGDAYGQFIGSL